MTTRLIKQSVFETEKTKVIQHIRQILKEDPIYQDVQEHDGGASFTAKVKPRFWVFGVDMSITVEEQYGGQKGLKNTLVKSCVRSQQWWIFVNPFGYYAKYNLDFFRALRNIKQRRSTGGWGGDPLDIYDEDGRLIMRVIYDGGGEYSFPKERFQYKYDESGKLIVEEIYDGDGQLKSKMVY